MKLRYLKMYDTKDVPDHVMQNLQDFSFKILEALKPVIEDVDSNIVLGALNFAHVIILKELVSDKPEELEKAAKLTAISIMENMKLLMNIED